MRRNAPSDVSEMPQLFSSSVTTLDTSESCCSCSKSPPMLDVREEKKEEKRKEESVLCLCGDHHERPPTNSCSHANKIRQGIAFLVWRFRVVCACVSVCLSFCLSLSLPVCLCLAVCLCLSVSLSLSLFCVQVMGVRAIVYKERRQGRSNYKLRRCLNSCKTGRRANRVEMMHNMTTKRMGQEQHMPACLESNPKQETQPSPPSKTKQKGMDQPCQSGKKKSRATHVHTHTHTHTHVQP